jgi:hypothetical protein
MSRPGQTTLQVDNEPDETPRRAYNNLLGSKCPASSRDRPRRKHPWGSVGGWNVPRGKPLDTQPLPSKQPVLLTDGNEMFRQFRTRSRLQLRADRESVSPRADLNFINS